MLYAFPVSQNVSFPCLFLYFMECYFFQGIECAQGRRGLGRGRTCRARLGGGPGLSCPTVIRDSCATAEPRLPLSGSPAPVRCVVPITHAPAGNSTWFSVASVSDTRHTVGERNLHNFAT